MKTSLNILKNRYFISTTILVVILLFFEDTSVFEQWKMSSRLNELVEKNKATELNIAELNKNVEELNTNPAALEKFARENCKMKKPDEVVFLFVEEKDRPKD